MWITVVSTFQCLYPFQILVFVHQSLLLLLYPCVCGDSAVSINSAVLFFSATAMSGHLFSHVVWRKIYIAQVFTALRYTSAVYAVVIFLSVCLRVCLSHAGIVSKQLY